MALDREAIMTALFTRLQGIAGVVTCDRNFKDWADVPPEAQPAIFLTNGNEESMPALDMPTKWTLQPTIYLYTRHDADPSGTWGAQQNLMLKAIETVFERTATEKAQVGAPFLDRGADAYTTTLGGLCAYAWIKGKVTKDEGLLQAQGVAIIPVEILTTS